MEKNFMYFFLLQKRKRRKGKKEVRNITECSPTNGVLSIISECSAVLGGLKPFLEETASYFKSSTCHLDDVPTYFLHHKSFHIINYLLLFGSELFILFLVFKML